MAMQIRLAHVDMFFLSAISWLRTWVNKLELNHLSFKWLTLIYLTGTVLTVGIQRIQMAVKCPFRTIWLELSVSMNND